MPDRVGLLSALASELPPLSDAANLEAEKALNKVIALFVSQLPLARARRMNGKAGRELRAALDQAMSYGELKKISKMWDPKRTVETSTSQTALVRELVELLDATREPFDPTPRPLQEARALDRAAQSALKDALKRFATRAQLNAILKKWDPRARYPADAPRQIVVQHLHELLDRTRSPQPA